MTPVIQLIAVLVVQAQVVGLAVIVTDELPACPRAETDVGDSVYVQGGGAAACDIVDVWLPAVTVAVRAVPGLAATVTTTAPVPVPLAGATVAHAALLDAVQPHEDALAVTVTLEVPPVAPRLPVAEERLYVQDGGAAACDIVYVWLPAVTVAVRAVPGLAATVTTTAPVPVPLAGATVAHAALLDAVQPHEDALAVTVTLEVPPVAPRLPVAEERLYVQGGGGTTTD